MATATVTPAAPVGLPPAAGRSGYLQALRSEWTKILSVRSTVWTLVATCVVTIGISTLIAWGGSDHLGREDIADFDPVRGSTFGILFGQLAIVVIGAMSMSSEYSTGMIRTSLTSMPRRGVVYTAKLTVITAVTLAVGLFCSFVSFFIGQAFYSNVHFQDFGSNGERLTEHTAVDLSASLGDSHVLQAVVGGGLYLAVSALMAFGLAALMRHTAGAITTAIAVLFLSFIMGLFLPESWSYHVQKWIPLHAGAQIWGVHKFQLGPDVPLFSPWAGFAVFTAYAAVAVIGGGILFWKRDA